MQRYGVCFLVARFTGTWIRLSRQRGSLVAIPGFVCATVLYIKVGFYLNLDTFPGGHTAEMITLLKKMDFRFTDPALCGC